MGVFQKWLFYMIYHGICSNKSFYHMATPQSLCLGFASPPVVFGGGMLGPRGLLRVENLIRPPRPGDTAMQRTATRWQPGRDSKAGRCPDARAGEARSAQSSRLRRPPAPCPGGPSAQAAEGGQVRATLPLPVLLPGCCGGPDTNSEPTPHCPTSSAPRLQTGIPIPASRDTVPGAQGTRLAGASARHIMFSFSFW